MATQRKCERCGVPEHDTPEGFLAYSGTRLVCADCDADLTNEWVAEDPEHNVHPLNALVSA